MNFKYTNEVIATAVAESKSWARVARILTGSDKVRTGHQTHFKRRAVKAEIDFSHFTGQGWNKGGRAINARPLQAYLVMNGPMIKSNDLKLKLIRAGIKKHQCEECRKIKWRGTKIPIELHHINGKPHDNRLVNLKIDCPNCHAQEKPKTLASSSTG